MWGCLTPGCAALLSELSSLIMPKDFYSLCRLKSTGINAELFLLDLHCPLLAFQLKLAACKHFFVSIGKGRLKKKRNAEDLLSLMAWRKELEGKLEKSRSRNSVIKNCNNHHHSKTTSNARDRCHECFSA